MHRRIRFWTAPRTGLCLSILLLLSCLSSSRKRRLKQTGIKPLPTRCPSGHILCSGWARRRYVLVFIQATTPLGCDIRTTNNVTSFCHRHRLELLLTLSHPFQSVRADPNLRTWKAATPAVDLPWTPTPGFQQSPEPPDQLQSKVVSFPPRRSTEWCPTFIQENNSFFRFLWGCRRSPACP